MKISLKPGRDHEFSVMQRIIDGTLTIDSIEEFEEILEIYEKDPLLFRRYADLLHQKGHLLEAIEAYDRTAELFLGLNMSLQAIVAKILQWSIQKPTHEMGRAFYALLHEGGSRQTPLQKFWARMQYPELIAVMLRLVRLRFPAGAVVQATGAPAEDLYFIVSGSAAEITPQDPPGNRSAPVAEPVLLGDNDIFGDIFPLNEATTAKKEIRVISDLELVKIAKNVLQDACQKHPQIESLLLDMYKPENRRNESAERSWQTVRRNTRFGLPTRAEVYFQTSSPGKTTKVHDAIALDMSLGGVCLDLGPVFEKFKNFDLKGRSVNIRLGLADDTEDLTAGGNIVWVHPKAGIHADSLLMGVRFDSLTTLDRDRLLGFCTDHAGEQNLLWSLWDTMVNQGGAE